MFYVKVSVIRDMVKTLLPLGILAASTIAACGKDERASRADREPAYIVVNQDLIRQKLKDPSSAEFRSVKVYYGSGSPVVCGEVNSKNSFGGKVGFQRFVSAGTVQAIEEEMAPGEMVGLWAKVCVG